MEALVKQRAVVRLRRIDIGSWESAVATQHGIRRLPSLALYAGKELVSDDTREIFELLSQE